MGLVLCEVWETVWLSHVPAAEDLSSSSQGPHGGRPACRVPVFQDLCVKNPQQAVLALSGALGTEVMYNMETTVIPRDESKRTMKASSPSPTRRRHLAESHMGNRHQCWPLVSCKGRGAVHLQPKLTQPAPHLPSPGIGCGNATCRVHVNRTGVSAEMLRFKEEK